MLRVTIAVILAAVVQFAWGFVFWATPQISHKMMNKPANEAAVAELLKQNLPESGTYFLPYPACEKSGADKATEEAFMKRHEEGPLVQIHYQKDGFAMANMPLVMAAGFGHLVVTAVLAALLLKMALPGLQTYLSRVLFVFGLGVFAAVAIHVSNLIWFHHHWQFLFGQVVYSVVGWLLAGGVMALIIRPMAAQHAQAAKPHHPSIAA